MTDETIPLPEPAITHDRTGHPLLMGPCFTADQVRAAVLAERERCAKVCDAEVRSLSETGNGNAALVAGICAAAIRSGHPLEE